MVKASELPKAIKNPKNAVKVAHSRFNFSMGKILYKNTAGLEANLKGRKSRKLMQKYHKKEMPKNPKIIEFQKKGYVSLGIPYDKEILEKVVEKYNKMIEDDKFSFVRSEYKGKVYSRMINRAHKQIPELKELITSELKEMFEEHFGGNFQINYTAMWRNYHVPPQVQAEKEIFSSAWHCDGADTEEITLFINLSDVKDEHGPLHLQSFERTKELVKMGFKTRQNPDIPLDVLEDPNYVVKNNGIPGTTILANSSICMHKAGLPKSGCMRDIMQFKIAPSREPLKDNWEVYCEDSSVQKIDNSDEANVKNRSIT